MFCKHCGNQIDDNAQFCSKCGKQVQEKATEKTKIDLWLVLIAVSILLLILSISVSQTWGDTPLNKLNTEDTIPSALLAIAAIGASGFSFFNEKKLKAVNKGNSKKLVFSTILFIGCLFMGVMFVLLPFFGSLS